MVARAAYRTVQIDYTTHTHRRIMIVYCSVSGRVGDAWWVGALPCEYAGFAAGVWIGFTATRAAPTQQIVST